MKLSEALLKWYFEPSVRVPPANHFVPVKKLDRMRMKNSMTQQQEVAKVTLPNTKVFDTLPNEKHAQAQIDEVAALAHIFPSEFFLLSKSMLIKPINNDPGDYFGDNL